MRDTTKTRLHIATMLLLGALALACRESQSFIGPDGVASSTDPGNPGEWSEPIPVEVGSSEIFFGMTSEVGGRFVFEIDWSSSANDVSFVVYREELTGDSFAMALCFVPAAEFGFLPESNLPTCSVEVSNRSRDKPKRVEFVAEDPAISYVLTVTNDGPGSENVRLREIGFDR